MNIYYTLLIIALPMMLVSCSEDQKTKDEIAGIPVNISIERFDQEFINLDNQKLADLKVTYPFLFPPQFPDSIWLKKSVDTLQAELSSEVLKKFPSLEKSEDEIKNLMQHIQYYFPEIKVPRVVTITSDVDYQQKIILADSLLLISLDTYLGTDHYFYQGIQQFIKKNFNADQLTSDIAARYLKEIIPLPSDRTFLANMIYYGKELYGKSKLLPQSSEAQLIGYTDEEWQWVLENEEQVWRYFIDRELLYKTDKNLSTRFLYPAPFSKFNLQLIDNESPDRVGRFIGWQIVKSFMRNKDVSLRQLINEDADQLFKASRYKPKKNE
ncbi:gliding motility lipoprotein GldB [Aquimarina sp. ERC-38]|uniref:gliding motility lipoprotein GldB n=1 Tax=Aquimarina sp. ERC-38 TaxID=2949996 RepID=UPI002247D30B|nr:gliding motility lipoprotein GldB [Aquimarina sp. ERC-38]UZO82501.1 gliding motility lipoprotein GldB [Aquimarina sp. ERC-38]